MLIGEHGDMSQAQIDQAARDKAEQKRIDSMSNKHLGGEIRRRMRQEPQNLLTQALGYVSLMVLGESFGNEQDLYCQRTGPNRPKTGRTRKKTELKKAAAKAI